MKLEHSINALSKVSFTSRPMFNPLGEPTGMMIDTWEDIPHSTAKGLEELQNRIIALEEKLESLYSEKGIIRIMEQAKAQGEKPEPPKKQLPRGESLESVKSKGGRPKKVESA